MDQWTLFREIWTTWLPATATFLVWLISCGLLLIGIARRRSEQTVPFTSFLCRQNPPNHSCANPGPPSSSSDPPIENPLRDSCQKLQLILDNIPQYVFWKDRRSVYQGCNRNFALAAGFRDPQDIVGKTDLDLPWAAAEGEWYRKCDREVMENGIPLYHIAESQLRADGKKVWIDTNKIPLHDATGKVVGLLGTYEDITVRKEAEEQLTLALADAEKAKEKINAILKAVTDGLLVVDLTGQIQLMNRAAENILDLSADSGLGRALETIVAEKPLVENIIRTLNGEKEIRPLELKVPDLTSGKDRIFLAITNRVAGRNGEITGALTLLRDITHEREVDRMKDEFIATAAHELRTPLTSILGFSEVLIKPEQFGVTEEEHKKELVVAVHESARRLNTIVTDLLDLSRVQSGRMITLKRLPCDIVSLLREEVKKYQNDKPRHQLLLSLPDKPIPILIDSAKVAQVINNLISNAVKFSAEGTRIRVVGEITQDFFQITVEDEGIGMTPAETEKVFDKFYRANSSDTAPEGLGLGMAIAKNIVEAHGGEIHLRSAVGIGTKVFFSLPLDSSSTKNDADKNLPAEKGDLL